MTSLIINIDTPDVGAAELFYAAAFGFVPVRRLFGGAISEMAFSGQLFHILPKPDGSAALPRGPARGYGRHWTPLHLDIVVQNLDVALERATEAGAVLERPAQTGEWGKIAGISDPFGHGWCLIELSADGYDAAAADMHSRT